MQKTCAVCNKEFASGRNRARFCSKVCRYEDTKKRSRDKWAEYAAQAYPNGIKIKTCRWCNEDMAVRAERAYAGRLYHPECSKEAQTARYRIKTVKRQSKTQRWRISHEQVIREYGDNCHICNQSINLDLPRTHKEGLTVDHLIPLAKGGTDDMSNLRPAHWSCNMRKSDKLMEELDA